VIKKINGIQPIIHSSCFVAETALVAGQVELQENSSIWYGTSLRGDIAPIVIGKNSNVQDCCSIHVSENLGTYIGDNVTIGHGANIHGCRIGNNTLIGMGAIILDGAVIGNNCLVAAGALVTPRTVIPDGNMVVGSPAQVKRPLKDQEIDSILQNAKVYIDLAAVFSKGEEIC